VIGRGQGREDEQNLITVFSVGEIRFAINVENLSEIIQFTDITAVSDRQYVLGTVDLRGAKVPILDVEGYFGVEASQQSLSLRSMIILKRNGGDGPPMMGMIVDRIEGVHREGELTFHSFPEIAQNSDTTVYQGTLLMEQDLILLLNTPRLMERAWAAR
jgi:chemotaxis signal transduction protein